MLPLLRTLITAFLLTRPCRNCADHAEALHALSVMREYRLTQGRLAELELMKTRIVGIDQYGLPPLGA